MTGQSNPKADNFAKPLGAIRFIASVVPFDDGANGPGVLISFDFDHKASKIAPSGNIVFVGDGTYLTEFVPDPDHPFAHCAGLS